MPVPCSSPINRPTKRPEPGLSPGARSMPGARQGDSVPEQKPAHDEPPARGATSSPRADAVDGPVAAHLARHAMLRWQFGE